MASKSERTIVEALGVPTGDTTAISFSTAAVSGVLDAETTFRLAATEDCYVRLGKAGDENVDTSDMLLFAGIPEIFQTTENETSLGVLRKGTDGVLHVTRMKSPAK
jgi:hypothetical protein